MTLTCNLPFHETCKLNIKWDDNIVETVNKQDEIAKSFKPENQLFPAKNDFVLFYEEKQP